MEEWLKSIEAEHHIEILFACEAGSRAWGYDSPNSDQDIRYIFRHRDLRKYLSLDDAAEVIHHSCPYDSQGWDVKKAFRLLRKSNPSLFEWSCSAIVYRDSNRFGLKLREVIKKGYSPYSLGKHYLSLARRNAKEAGAKSGTELQQKQLIYSLRSLIVIKGLSENMGISGTIIPTGFSHTAKMNDHMTSAFLKLVEAKQNGVLLPPVEAEEMLELIYFLHDQLAGAVEELPTGKDITGMLNGWVWKLLNV